MPKKGAPKVEKEQERVDFEPAKLDENATSVYAELSASLPTAEAASATQEAEAKVMQAGADARAQRIYELEAKIAAMEAKAAGRAVVGLAVGAPTLMVMMSKVDPSRALLL